MKFDDPVVIGLVKAIRAQYTLDWDGIHGIPHWSRVWENGMRIAEEAGAHTEVVGLFALFHDARRFNDGRSSSQVASRRESVRPSLSEDARLLRMYRAEPSAWVSRHIGIDVACYRSRKERENWLDMQPLDRHRWIATPDRGWRQSHVI
jgi:hypothetical protein